jgi:hypothetical protein
MREYKDNFINKQSMQIDWIDKIYIKSDYIL